MNLTYDPRWSTLVRATHGKQQGSCDPRRRAPRQGTRLPYQSSRRLARFEPTASCGVCWRLSLSIALGHLVRGQELRITHAHLLLLLVTRRKTRSRECGRARASAKCKEKWRGKCRGGARAVVSAKGGRAASRAARERRTSLNKLRILAAAPWHSSNELFREADPVGSVPDPGAGRRRGVSRLCQVSSDIRN